MELNRKTIKRILLIVCVGVILYCALQHLDAVAAALGWLVRVVAPFLVGCAIAFILNVPMRWVERHLYPASTRGTKLRRPLALVLTLALVAGIIALASLG